MEGRRSTFTALDTNLFKSCCRKGVATIDLQILLLHVAVSKTNSGLESGQIHHDCTAHRTGPVGDRYVADECAGPRLEAAADGQWTHDRHEWSSYPIGVSGRLRRRRGRPKR